MNAISSPFRVAVLDDYQRVALQMADWRSLPASVSVEVFDRPLGSLDAAAAALQPFDAVCLMRERQPFPRALFERLPRLRLLTLTGGRAPSLDSAAATDHGVLISHTRSGGTHETTVELTWALILATARHLPREDRNVRAGGWQHTLGTRLHGKTLGLLGLGKLGAGVARIGQAFGMNLIAWSTNLTAARAGEVGAEWVSKKALFARSDVLSVHLVLGERSRGLVGAVELTRMRPGAIFINTSRGPIVDEAALIAALQENRLAGAGLDVFDQEPLPPEHPLRRLENVVLSPHLGYVTAESYAEYYHDTVENLAAFLAGKPLRVLNPDVLGKMRPPPLRGDGPAERMRRAKPSFATKPSDTSA